MVNKSAQLLAITVCACICAYVVC